jgi:peptidoglycan/xylan/chitin deacetylase (PgdA/CDA1 family)
MAEARATLGRFKAGLARLLESAGVLARQRRRRAVLGQVPVLALHRVCGSDEARLPQAIPPGDLERLVAEAARRYRVASWTECERASRRRDPRPHLAMTFDDGYRDGAETAWPILRRHGATAVFCLATAFVDGGEPLWWEVVAAALRAPGAPFPRDRAGEATYGPLAEAEIGRLKGLPRAEMRHAVAALAARAPSASLSAPMSWADAERLAAEGAELAAHGATHAILTRCDDGDLAAELAGARAVLEKRLGREVSLLAYPNGDHDPRVAAAACRAGFRFAFATRQGYYGPGSARLAVPRITVRAAMYRDGRGFCWPLFEAEMLGLFDRLLLRRIRMRR